MFILSLFSSEPPDQGEEEVATEEPASSSIISRGANIEGILDLTSVNLSIEGTVHGDISTDGRVVVAEGAEVKGTINAETIRVAGYVEGHVLARETLVLCPTAEVHATLEADVLEIQPGADFTGDVPETQQFVPDTSESSPSTLDSTELLSEPVPAENETAGNVSEEIESR